jgi:PPM family protein phosphatase
MKFIKKYFGLSNREDTEKRGGELAFGATDAGRVRDGNEDFLMVSPERNLYIAADGMGGHNAGEVASANATEVVDAYFNLKLLSGITADDGKIRDAMTGALIEAHEKILEMAKTNPEYSGMGCTMVVALINGDSLYLCHVGDARAYVCDHAGINLLTTDHSNVMMLVKAGRMTMEEARTSPIKNELSQAIGAPLKIVPEYVHYTLKDGDKVLLCSDGLWDMLTDDEIYQILKQEKTSRAICQNMIERANDAGGNDNITVVVVVHQGEENIPEATDFEGKNKQKEVEK